MNRFWSILFFLVPLGVLAAFAMAALGVQPLGGAWLPENYSESGVAIDRLWYLVHAICAFFLVLPGLLIAWVLWKYSGANVDSAKSFRSHVGLELVWTVIPAAILAGLAFYQLKTWSAQRVDRPTIKVGEQELLKPEDVRVIARQFGWTFVYPGEDQKFDTLDDVQIENLMVVPKDETIVMKLESKDVIHSFFVPSLRLKHDVVPGMIQFAWFKPTRTGTLDVVCAELCGWGHYKMNASLRIVDRNEFDLWMAEQEDRIKAPVLNPVNDGGP